MKLDEQYDKIYRYCYFRLGSREVAEDITQEAFLRFFEAHGYTESGKSLQYLYTVARNLCIDRARKIKPISLEAEFDDNEPSDNGNTVDELVAALAVRSALSRLDDSERELLLLRYVNELPVSLLARLYRLSRFALHRRLKSAEKHLSDLLSKEGIE